MNLYLKRMELENFKGVQKAAYDFGDETRIDGQNASGKSTIVDAFCWLLFNKDSHGNAPGSDKFREKPLDANGQEIHYLETSVTACFDLDGQPFNLRRMQKENWVKKRGCADATYQGNVSTYWINEVETKSTDFSARIASIANGDVFLLITTLGAFTAMDWKKRRALLMSLSGIDVDAELLTRAEYAAIAKEAAAINASIDDLRKVFTDRKKRIAQELTLIPARIDEARRMRPEFTDREMNDAEFNLNDALADLQKCDALIAKQSAGDGSAATLQSQILSVESELIAAKRRISDDFNANRDRLRRDLNDAIRRNDAAQKAQIAASKLAADAKVKVSDSGNALENLRAEYKTVYASSFMPPDVQDVCPTCGQAIPQERIESAIADAKTRFDADRANRLAEINRRGQELKQRDMALREACDAAEEALAQADADFTAAQHDLDTAKAEYAAYPAVPDFTADARIVELQDQLYALRTEKTNSPDEKMKQLVDRRDELQARIDNARAILAKRDTAKQVDARIAELEANQTELGQKRAELEVLICDAEHFIADRCGLLEESINSRFPTIRWKLFDRQINGALVDCCECLIPSDGTFVPYGCANTAASVNADIEIIGVLSRHYDVTAPLFVDNAERVNYIVRPAGQLITLSVSNQPTLNITHSAYKNKEVA